MITRRAPLEIEPPTAQDKALLLLTLLPPHWMTSPPKPSSLLYAKIAITFAGTVKERRGNLQHRAQKPSPCPLTSTAR